MKVSEQHELHVGGAFEALPIRSAFRAHATDVPFRSRIRNWKSPRVFCRAASTAPSRCRSRLSARRSDEGGLAHENWYRDIKQMPLPSRLSPLKSTPLPHRR